jgi:Lon protease-like protein
LARIFCVRVFDEGGAMSQHEQIEVSLFPLPNLVLFPGALLPLHIFEERYKELVAECIEAAAPFGVVMLAEPPESRASIRKVGVLARIRNFERLEDGRMNIVTEGDQRFRIARFTSEGPRWKAAIEVLADEPESAAVLAALASELGKTYLEAYAKGLELTGDRPQDIQLPASPRDLSFMVAYVLDMDAEEKQYLLEMTSTRVRLETLVGYLERANERLTEQVERKKAAEAARNNGHLGDGARGAGRDRGQGDSGPPEG